MNHYSNYCINYSVDKIQSNKTKLKWRSSNKTTNIVTTEIPFIIEAKTSDINNKKSISYHLVESAHSLCLNKIETISAQIQACERLLKYIKDEKDLRIIEKENEELKFALDLINLSLISNI